MVHSYRTLLLSVFLIVGLLFSGIFGFVKDNQAVQNSESTHKEYETELRQTEVFRNSVVEFNKDVSFLSISSDDSLNPSPAKDSMFIVSLYINFHTVPKLNRRVAFIGKYLSKQYPYAGWALAIRNSSVAMRPEVYILGDNGTGGWFSFDAYKFEPNNWYAISMVYYPGNSLLLFVEPIFDLEKFPLLKSQIPPSDNEIIGNIKVKKKQKGELIFLGGHNLEKVKVPATAADLKIGSLNAGSLAFRGQISSVLLAKLSPIPKSRVAIEDLLLGGSRDIADRLKKENISLFIGDEGKDNSLFSRELSARGDVLWR